MIFGEAEKKAVRLRAELGTRSCRRHRSRGVKGKARKARLDDVAGLCAAGFEF